MFNPKDEVLEWNFVASTLLGDYRKREEFNEGKYNWMVVFFYEGADVGLHQSNSKHYFNNETKEYVYNFIKSFLIFSLPEKLDVYIRVTSKYGETF
jgi:hypothetical protein